MGRITITVEHVPGTTQQDFGRHKLSYLNADGSIKSVLTKCSFDDFKVVGINKNSTAFDFFIFASIIYNVDRAINREFYADDGWARELCVTNIPVANIQAFNQAKSKLESAISFLTGDTWCLSFVQYDYSLYQPSSLPIEDLTKYKKVSLFSGGLDSLIGFVDMASSLSINEKILLVSHKELGKEGGDQKRILKICQDKGYFTGKYNRILINVGLNTKSVENSDGLSEGTFRSRSLLFFAAGIYVANQISSTMPMYIPENGTISINIPLDKSRRSSCSTRTTHPTFLKRLQDALAVLDIENKLINPYQYQSKADMMNNCCADTTRKMILKDLYSESCSCAKRSHNRFWDRRNVRHCGCCLPCIYRRVSLAQVSWDKPKHLGIDMFKSKTFRRMDTSQIRSNDFRALLYFIKNRCNKDVIRTELMLNGITDEDELGKYTTLALHSYDQVKKWLLNNGIVL